MEGGTRTSAPAAAAQAAGPGSIWPTSREEALFTFLCDVVKHFNLTTTLRVAGGWVRDKLLGKESDDIDIAIDNMTGLQYAQLVNERLAQLGHETRTLGVIQANPEQSKHLETVAVSVLGFDIDMVNLRSETYAEGSRIPTVEFGTPYTDAARRDLTINALFYNLQTREVEDFTGYGVVDLHTRVCRTPLAPRQTFLDDPLRVLRAVRFATRLRFELSPDIVAAARTPEVQDALCTKVSRERVTIELGKVLKSTTASPILAFRMLRSMGLLGTVFALPTGCSAASLEPVPPDVTKNQRREEEAEASDQAARCKFEDEAMASLEALHIVLHGTLVGASDGSPLVPVSSAVDVRRIAWLAGALLPTRGLVIPSGKKGRATTLSEATMRLALPGLSTADVSGVETVLSSVDPLVPWLRCPDVPAGLSRLEIGLQVREGGTLFPVSVAIALVSASAPFDAAQALPAGADVDINLLPQERASWMEASRSHAEAASALLSRVNELGLENAHELRPIITGNELMTEAGVPRGPAVGRAARAVLEYQLGNRYATRAGAISHVRQFLAENGGSQRR